MDATNLSLLLILTIFISTTPPTFSSSNFPPKSKPPKIKPTKGPIVLPPIIGRLFGSGNPSVSENCPFIGNPSSTRSPPGSGGGLGCPSGTPGASGTPGTPGSGVPGAPGTGSGSGIPGTPGSGVPGAPGTSLGTGAPGPGAPGTSPGTGAPGTGAPGPTPPGFRGPATCPIDTLKLGACVDLLGGLVHVLIGDPGVNQCCPVLEGLLELEAAVCLCTAIRARLLDINVYLPIAPQLLITCGINPPPGFVCTV